MVSQAGVLSASGIILICTLSTFLTTLSLSALATNGRIHAGGPYAIVRQNLGPEMGAAIGVLFYLGTTLDTSVAVLGKLLQIQFFACSFNKNIQVALKHCLRYLFLDQATVWI